MPKFGNNPKTEPASVWLVSCSDNNGTPVAIIDPALSPEEVCRIVDYMYRVEHSDFFDQMNYATGADINLYAAKVEISLAGTYLACGRNPAWEARKKRVAVERNEKAGGNQSNRGSYGMTDMKLAKA